MKKIFLFLIIAGFFLLSVGCSLSNSSSSSPKASSNVDEQNAPTPVTCDPSVVVNPPAQGQPKCEDYLGTWKARFPQSFSDLTLHSDGTSNVVDVQGRTKKWQYNANNDGRARTLSLVGNSWVYDRIDFIYGFEDLSDLTKLCAYDSQGCNPAVAFTKQP